MSGDATVIGPYKRAREIGRGSFATVYEGHHTVTKQMVAIKSIYKAKLNKKIRENLTLEIEILKQLDQPHIVRLLDFLGCPWGRRSRPSGNSNNHHT
ncbi:Serine/threonine-protein kinase [Ascosphaera acerosa]|nr:Serine/threonine-protein kinase [Ascosphaera acerosa]